MVDNLILFLFFFFLQLSHIISKTKNYIPITIDPIKNNFFQKQKKGNLNLRIGMEISREFNFP